MMTQKPFSFASDPNPFLFGFAKNPFAPRCDEVPADAPEGSYTYKLVQSGPAVPSDECETAVAAVEILIRWGTTVLHVAHLTPPRSFFVGEDLGKGQPKNDFFLPEEKLGVRRMPLVLAGEGSPVRLVVPAGATGTAAIAGGPQKSLRDLADEPCAELAGATQLTLPLGSSAKMEVGGLAIEVSTVHAGKKPSRGALTGEALPYTGLSFLLHAALLAATALFVPTMAMADEDSITDEQKYEIMHALGTDALKEPEQRPDERATDVKPGEHGTVGQAGGGEMGKAGSVTSHHRNGRFGVEGKGPEQYLSRTEALRQAQDFGMIGILQGMQGSLGSPTSPWGRETASGIDPKSAQGNIWGDTIDDAAGSGGLNLLGIGEGGGNRGEGIGVGNIGTVGHDFVGGNGRSSGHLSGVYRPKSHGMMHSGNTVVSGRLPPEIIQRVVRQNFGRFKACYEIGLRSNPSLAGRVAVRFVIGHDGAVGSAANGGSDLPDANVVSCVTRAFHGLSFPHPENGIVTVTYPIVFSPVN